ncbi:hypothetical protein [Bartonella sp. LB28NMGDW]|uniref:hypothetical protein n=1 Tax=Bartonella sp. LB28NMGDW TaxID=3243549 RepID=UPI0035D0E1AD
MLAIGAMLAVVLAVAWWVDGYRYKLLMMEEIVGGGFFFRLRDDAFNFVKKSMGCFNGNILIYNDVLVVIDLE